MTLRRDLSRQVTTNLLRWLGDEHAERGEPGEFDPAAWKTIVHKCAPAARTRPQAGL